MMMTLRNSQQALELAQSLLAGGKPRPTVVVTTPAWSALPLINMDELARAVGDDCDIVIMPAGPITFSFADQLLSGRQVYGGPRACTPSTTRGCTTCTPLTFTSVSARGTPRTH